MGQYVEAMGQYVVLHRTDVYLSVITDVFRWALVARIYRYII